ncbi:hypothetical protein H4Q26_009566, partial [Puccinia striiformis f. sp. tritici PST-130]
MATPPSASSCCKSRGGRAPRSARPAVRTSPTQARRLGPVLRSVPARRGVIRNLGNRNSPVISPAISAVRGRYLDPISSPRIITVNRFVVSSSHRNPFLQHTPTQRFVRPMHLSPTWSYVQRNMVPDPNRPPSPEWAGALRDTAPNANSPIFRMGIPILPRSSNAGSADVVLAPAGFDPSPRADAWAQRTSSASSGSAHLGSNSGIIMYHRLNDDQIHFFLKTLIVLTLTMYLVSSYHLRNIITPSSHQLYNYCHEFQLQIRLSSVLVSASSSACLAFEVVLDSLNV